MVLQNCMSVPVFNFCTLACFFCIAFRSYMFSKLHLGPLLALLHAYFPVSFAFSICIVALSFLHAFALFCTHIGTFCMQAPIIFLNYTYVPTLHFCMHLHSHIIAPCLLASIQAFSALLHTYILHCTPLEAICTQTPTFSGP